jgi:serine/threonine-protein kinase haspin
MLSPSIATASHNDTLLHRKPTTRTVAQKKVYGKKRANAPRAVLDDGSPFRSKRNGAKAHAKTSKQNTLDDAVAEVEAKLAAIKIDEPRINGDGVENQETPTATSAKERRRTSIKTANILRQQKTTEFKTPVKPRQVTGDDVKTSAKARDSSPTERSSSRRDPKKRSPRRNKPNKPTPRLSSGCIQDGKINSYVHEILNEAMSSIASQGVQKFSSWAARSENAFDTVKIAEGSYGEVYKLRLREDVCKREMSKSRLAKLRAYGEGVFKIVPLRAQHGPGSKKFTRVDEIVAEVKLLKLLDPIPGFARFREVHVVQGRFPESFQKAWMTYKQTQSDSMNPNPANKRAYTDNQLWAILEMDDAGVELEKFSWSSIFQVYDIFWGVAMALARAEEYALFEVRVLSCNSFKKYTMLNPAIASRSSLGKYMSEVVET